MFHPCRTIPSIAALTTLLSSATLLLHAQDLRTVKEPVIPATCVTLKASFTAAIATSGEVELRAEKAGSAQADLDTPRLKQALDHCAKGTAVELAADGGNTAFLTGPIALPPGVTLLIDKGVTLYGTRNPEFYAVSPGSCGIVNDESANGCKPLIAVRNAIGTAIMGDGVIDGQGGAHLIVDGKVTAESWWDLAEDARSAGRQQTPRLIDTDLADDVTLYRITLRNSPSVHIAFHRGDGLTVWAVKIDTPATARNTDGIDPAQSKNITITQSFIRDGDDNIAIKAADGPTTNITIAHNHFYWGHGISIGPETTGGVSGIRVQDLSLDGPENGIRIKSSANHGGPVEDVLYDDVCIRDAKSPIAFFSDYSFPGKGIAQLPVYQDITLHNVRITGGGKVQFDGFDKDHRTGVTLDGVLTLDNPARYHAQASHADLTFGPGPVNFIFTGDDANVRGRETNGTLPACSSKLIPFPQ